MPSKKTSLHNNLEALCKAYIDDAVKEVESRITLDKHKALRELSSELGFVCLSQCERDRLLEDAVSTKDRIDEEVKKQVTERTEQLQRQLNHEIDKIQLAHAVVVARFEEKIKHLESLNPQQKLVEAEAEISTEPQPDEQSIE